MEDTKSSATSPVEPIAISPFMRVRNVPDVPEDVDFLMDHLNDPNYDLKKGPPSISGSEGGEKKKRGSYSDTDSQFDSDRYTDRPESRNSTAIDFDE